MKSLVSNPQKEDSKSLNDLTICLIAVAGAFLILVIPFAVVSIILYSKPKSCSFFKAQYIIGPLTLTNSSLNFFLYYWKLAPFRRAVKKLFGKHQISDASSVEATNTRTLQ